MERRLLLALDLWVAATVALSIAGMKWSSLRVAPLAGSDLRSFVRSPVVAVASWRKRRAARGGDLITMARDLALVSPLLVTTWWLYLRWAPVLRPGPWMKGYLAIIPFWAFIQIAATLVELPFVLGGWRYPPHMRYPFLARSIDEFWGRRWGTWVADWLRQVVLSRYRRQPLGGMVAVFVVSGLWHELLVDVPLYLFYGSNVLGGWLAYFLVQAAGMALERRYLRPHPRLAIAFAWLVVLVPAPLALNQATLGVVGL